MSLAVSDPSAAPAGHEAEEQRLARMLGVARVVEVKQFLLDQLVAVDHLAPPSRVCFPVRLAGIMLLAVGLGAFAGAWFPLGGVALVAGVGLLVLARCMGSRPPLLAGGQPLLRWHRRRCEVMIPADAVGELVSPLGTSPLSEPVAGRPRGEAHAPAWLPLPLEGVMHLRVGELRIRTAWVSLVRWLPPAQVGRRCRWGAVAGFLLSLLAHLAALGLVFSIPPSSGALDPDLFDPTPVCVYPGRPVSPPILGVQGPHRLHLFPGTIGPLGVLGQEISAPVAELESDPSHDVVVRCACSIPSVGAKVYVGHLIVSGPRSVHSIRRELAHHARKLKSCYRSALRRCAEAGRMVLSLHIHGDGGVDARLLSLSSFGPDAESGSSEPSDSSLGDCVLTAAEAWRFRPIPVTEPTRVRLPLIFRVPGGP